MPFEHKRRVIISLCDYSTIWSRPFAEHGCMVYAVDPKHNGDYETLARGGAIIKIGMTIQEFTRHYLPVFERAAYMETLGIIAQPPCTQFAGSGARWWKDKPPHLLEEALAVVDDILELVHALNPSFWVIENPVGRLGRLRLGQPVMTFQPYEYAGWADDPMQEAYSKRTCLWGRFNHEGLVQLKRPVDNVHGSAMWARYGGASERTKTMRSMTPQGFAKAFYYAHEDYVC